MPVLVWAMLIAGVTTLVVGLLFAWPRFQAATGAAKLLALAPVFEAAPLAVFAMEHFFDARDLMAIVPKWLPWHLFWTYFVGVALVAAAISFIAWRYVRWSASFLALMFLIFVATMDIPGTIAEPHNRINWILTFRELSFSAGAMALAGSVWPGNGSAGPTLIRISRVILAATLVFYAVEHFLYPRNVPGVPLEKITPEWIPAPTFITYFVGAILLLAGPALLIPRTTRIAATGAGAVLLLVTFFFYGPILVAELHTPLVVEGINYVYDTMLFAATVLMAGLEPSSPDV